MKMTPKQSAFCEEYLKDFSGTRAAIAAGYSKKTARSIAAENLTKPYIQRQISQRAQAIARKIEIDTERALSEIARSAFIDPKALFKDDGTMKPISELPDNVSCALAAYEISTRHDEDEMPIVTTKVKMNDKLKALEMLGKLLGMFADQRPPDQQPGMKHVDIAERLEIIERGLERQKQLALKAAEGAG